VREHFGDDVDRQTAAMPGGAALHDGQTAWVYSTTPHRCLGQALALAHSRGCTALHLVLDDDGGVAARRAALLRAGPSVWRIDDRSLVPVPPTPRPERTPPPGADALVPILRDAGLEVVTEHGVISGEIRGLSVATIVPDACGHARLAVGVGRLDQEATDLLHADLPVYETLANAIDEVRVHRHAHAKPHPVNRLARERWLRSQVVAHPALVGLDDLEPVAPAEPRANLRDPVPAAAVGAASEARVLVLCSVGIDLELVPTAADLIDREHCERVVFATPARDHHALQRDLAARLSVPFAFTAVEGEWPA
jgi:hypothetical protein